MIKEAQPEKKEQKKKEKEGNARAFKKIKEVACHQVLFFTVDFPSLCHCITFYLILCDYTNFEKRMTG